ncbi:MAG: tetratricopeptide repeat protein [Cyclobacteriaceae bacterium]|nr:tetratricopeptide repeat protein [Cyclobacteriaceae bacterium]
MHCRVGLLCIAIYPAASRAQRPARIDSLLSVIKTTDNDSVKVRALNAVSYYFIFNNPDTAQQLLKHSRSVSQPTAPSYSFAESLLMQGVYFEILRIRDSAQHYFKEVHQLAQQHAWYDLEERSLNNLGMSNLNGGKFDTALDFFSKGYELLQTRQPTDFLNQGKYLSNIGLVYQELRQYVKAIEYHQQALTLRKQYASANDQAISFANLGVCFKSQGDFNKAVEHYSEAIRLSKQANNMRMYYALHDNMGNSYLDNKEYSKAIPYLLTSLNIPESIGKNPKGSLSALSNLANAHVQLNQPKQALAYANQGIAILNENPELENYALTLFKSASHAEYMLQNAEAGAAYFKRYVTISDSVFSRQNANAIADLQVKYETEKKEQQIALQQAELEEHKALNQRNTIILVSLVMLLVLSVLVILLVVNRNKRKALLVQKENELLVKEAQVNAALTSQETERKRFAQDLHDGFGQLISALRLHLDHLQKEDQPGQKASIFDKTTLVIENMHAELRNIAFNLMPAVLIHNGLPAALKELAAQLNAYEKVAVTATDFGVTQRFAEILEINLYRITQEWINNIIKYNTADKIDIQLVQHENAISFTIEDNGTGFNAEELEDSKGNGWRNIQSRLNLVQGKIRIDTRPGVRGTTLILEIPVQVSEKNRVSPVQMN